MFFFFFHLLLINRISIEVSYIQPSKRQNIIYKLWEHIDLFKSDIRLYDKFLNLFAYIDLTTRKQSNFDGFFCENFAESNACDQ